jgi:alkaline phosphatase D
VTGKKRYGPASPTELQQGFDALKTNQTIGYTQLLTKKDDEDNNTTNMPIFGTWDDHDYGGNDMGQEMPQRRERQNIFWEFLGYRPAAAQQHDGVYHSVELETDGRLIKLLLLDTRWFRQSHCIPSVAHKMPMGNAIACATRWWTAGLYLSKFAWLWGMDGCEQNELLGEAQWKWLEEELLSLSNNSSSSSSSSPNANAPELFIIGSSVQVWTTNPAMESWGHFPKEQERLWNLLERHYNNANANTNTKKAAPVMFWSGDVHHAEIIGQPGYLEITSSGLTHHCGEPKLYGPLCQPLAKTFKNHRYQPDAYYIGYNYGVLEVDWDARIATVQIKNATGGTVLQVDQSLDTPVQLPAYKELPHTWDGHLIPWLRRVLVAIILAIGIARRLLKRV